MDFDAWKRCCLSLLCFFFFFYLFMGSIFEKATKYFPAPLRVSFRIFVKRKAKIGLQTLQT